MGDDEAIKLVITRHTHSEKLQSAIIQKDMDLAKLVSTARAMELAQKEVTFLKNNPLNADYHTIRADAIAEDKRRNYTPRRDHFKKPTKKTIEICRYCGEKVPHNRCKARNATCNLCGKKGHFGKVCESTEHPVKETNRVEHQNGNARSQKDYPSTMVPIEINHQTHTMKVDSGSDANFISAYTYQELHPQPTLQPSIAKLKPYGSPPIPLLGQFTANITANGKDIETTIYVTKNPNAQSLTGKYTAFDLEILHINVNHQKVMLNVHNIGTQEYDTDTQTLLLHQVQHMDYNQMAKHLTPPEASEEKASAN